MTWIQKLPIGEACIWSTWDKNNNLPFLMHLPICCPNLGTDDLHFSQQFHNEFPGKSLLFKSIVHLRVSCTCWASNQSYLLSVLVSDRPAFLQKISISTRYLFRKKDCQKKRNLALSLSDLIYSHTVAWALSPWLGVAFWSETFCSFIALLPGYPIETMWCSFSCLLLLPLWFLFLNNNSCALNQLLFVLF